MTMTNSTVSALTPGTLAGIAQFKKALGAEKGAITSRATARAKQAFLAFGIGAEVLAHQVANSAETTAEATGLERAKVLRIGYMARTCKGLESVPSDTDEEQVAALAHIWQVVSGSKGLKAAQMDRIGRTKFATVEALADAVKEAGKVKAAATPEQALKALEKALTMLGEASVQTWTEEQFEVLEEGQELFERVMATAGENVLVALAPEEDMAA